MNPDETATIDLDQLGSQLVELSEFEHELPPGFQPVPSRFDDVDWTTYAWMKCLHEIQGWLNLDRLWDGVSARPTDALEELFQLLDVENFEDCIEQVDGAVRLTALGASELSARLSDAIRHRCVYEEHIENGAEPEYANRQWSDAWEEDLASQVTELVSLHASVDKWRIQNFKLNASEGNLNLNPSYQRDVVWSASDSQKLIDSILRGIPLPSIILNERRDSEVMEIVDGKQRLTAILRFMGEHPDGLAYASTRSSEDELRLYHSDYRVWRKIKSIKAKIEREEFLPFPLSTYGAADPLHHLSGKYYYEIKQESVDIQGKKTSIQKLFDSAGTNYHIPIIKYEDTDIRQIHRVFGLYNKQGKHLNAEELRNAIYHHLDLTKLLLVLSGDNDSPQRLVPYLNETASPIATVPRLLRAMNVSTSRYKRTKLISWACALLAHRPPSTKKDGFSTPSTATFIEQLLKAVSDDSSHPLRSKSLLQQLSKDLISGAELMFHLMDSDVEAIAPKFTHKKTPGEKWEDLPSVGMLLACTLASMAGVKPEISDDVSEQLVTVTGSKPLEPLENQQSITQWQYIGRVVVGVLEGFNVDVEDANRIAEDRYGSTSLTALHSFAVGPY